MFNYQYKKIIKKLQQTHTGMDKALEINFERKEALVDIIFNFVSASGRNLYLSTPEILIQSVLENEKIKNRIKKNFKKRELQNILFAVQAAIKFHFQLNFSSNKPTYKKGNNEIN